MTNFPFEPIFLFFGGARTLQKRVPAKEGCKKGLSAVIVPSGITALYPPPIVKIELDSINYRIAHNLHFICVAQVGIVGAMRMRKQSHRRLFPRWSRQ